MIIDTIFYIFSTLIWLGKGEGFEEPGDFEVSSDLVTVLLPVKREKFEVVKYTVDNIRNQTTSPKIWILLDEGDKCAEELKSLEAELKIYKNRSKADAINKIVEEIKSKYVLIIDAGDGFENGDEIENMLKVAEKGYDAVVPVLKAQRAEGWRNFVDIEFKFWTKNCLGIIKRRFGFIPLPGTGLLIRTDALRENKFPDLLTEDAALGLKIRNVAITDSATILYNLPPGRLKGLWKHIKQRGRWVGGYLQTFLKMAKGKSRIVYILPLVQGLVLISFALSLLSFFSSSYPGILGLVDWISFGIWLFYIKKAYDVSENPLSFLLSFWYCVVGLPSVCWGIYYAAKKEWYHSEKDTVLHY